MFSTGALREDAHADDAETYINSPGRGFLGNLACAPASSAMAMRQYAWRGREQFLRDTAIAFNNSDHEDDCDQYFLVTNVTGRIYNSAFRDGGEDTDDPFSRWCAYDSALELLLFRMVVESSVHGVVAPEFYEVVHDALRPMRLTRELAKTGTAGNEGPSGAKQPDAAWRPIRVPYNRNKGWPSVVLEVGYSESQKKLQSDIRFWLRQSEGHVKTVLTVAIRDRAESIIIEKWENGENGRAHAEQHLKITRNRRTNTATVTGGPLVIGFENLFSRPISSPIEQDIQLGNDQLQQIAQVIWQEADKGSTYSYARLCI
ncbi:hypothetical protein BJX68DRAFT_260983 [Aspergillus pseudodeflectus]|uniref:Uncharacterized protein n=1 Tax=Aspergillus pseudodeflectus TaxID=176178 RepID=A0ABR4L6N7_9EURO